MSLILIPQISGAMLPANVHRRMARKTGNFIIHQASFPISVAPVHISASTLEDRDPQRQRRAERS